MGWLILFTAGSRKLCLYSTHLELNGGFETHPAPAFGPSRTAPEATPPSLRFSFSAVLLFASRAGPIFLLWDILSKLWNVLLRVLLLFAFPRKRSWQIVSWLKCNIVIPQAAYVTLLAVQKATKVIQTGCLCISFPPGSFVARPKSAASHKAERSAL